MLPVNTNLQYICQLQKASKKKVSMVKLRELITWTYKAPGLINKSPGDKCSPQYKRKICRNQEIIKVRKWIPHIGPLTKVVPLKLFLDTVPSPSGNYSTLRGCFREGFVYTSVISFQTKGKRCGDVFLTIFRLSVCFNTFENSIGVKLRHGCPLRKQKQLNERQRNVKTNECKANKRSYIS